MSENYEKLYYSSSNFSSSSSSSSIDIVLPKRFTIMMKDIT